MKNKKKCSYCAMEIDPTLGLSVTITGSAVYYHENCWKRKCRAEEPFRSEQCSILTKWCHFDRRWNNQDIFSALMRGHVVLYDNETGASCGAFPTEIVYCVTTTIKKCK